MSEENDYPKGEEQGYEGDGPNLRYDDFVGRIVQDPNEPPSVTLLSGYLGSSSEEEHVRLYLDEELSRYVEIPEKAILHSQELPPEQSPLGGSLVWIDSGAEVVHGPAGSERRKANFLEGQIAQDYIGGGGGAGYGGAGDGDMTTQTRECGGGGGGLRPTKIGPGCGESQFGFCIPPTEQVYCRTLTGIFCTRFGPGCRRTLFEPACTLFGPNCNTAVFQQCHSVHYPCVTQHQTYCAESGFRGCGPIDLTVVEQYDPRAQARRGGLGGFDDPTFTVFQTGSNCPSVFDNCATRESFCPSQSVLCSSRFGGCITQSPFCVTGPGICDFETRSIQNCIYSVNVRCQPTEVNCPSRDIPCPTRFEPRCRISAVAFCPDTVAGCQVNTARCGEFDPGGIVLERRADVAAGPGGIAAQVSQFCQSQLSICDTQHIARCRTRDLRFCMPTYVLICRPTPYCPTQAHNGCPGYTQFGSCETFGACPSAVDACPTRFGCESQAGCYESIACQSQGCYPGGGGFDPAGGGGGGVAGGGGGVAGGGGAQAFAARQAGGGGGAAQFPTTGACATTICYTWPARCGGGGGAQAFGAEAQLGGGAEAAIQTQSGCYPSQFVRCPSAVDLCPTRYNCPSRYTPCQSQLIRCPSALDACPTRYNCPSVTSPCVTQDFSCETRARCPSAVDACPTRFGCYETQICVSQVCQQTQACYPQGGGGGFDPAGGGGGGGGF